MSRMKTFLIYALIVLAIVLCTDGLSNIILESNYVDLGYDVGVESPKIEILEAKTTKDNGRIKIRITNNTDKKIENKFLKIDLYSDISNLLGTEYVKIEGIEKGESQEFELKYSQNNVHHFRVTMIDELPQKTYTYHVLTKEGKIVMTIAGLIVLYALPPFFFFNIFF